MTDTSQQPIYPLLISPRFDERIWGGHDLADKLGKAAPEGKPIGESWEVYDENRVSNGPLAGQSLAELRGELGESLMGGHLSPAEPFPVLTKILDAQDVLSVQVHPDDAWARKLEGQPNGKTECWYVISAAPDATLTYGFTRDTSPEEYVRLVNEGGLGSLLRQIPVKAGDVVYLPAGTVHAIGAGILIYEVQQTSDVTYRIYDWDRRDAEGNPRELHVDKAKHVLEYHALDRGPIQPLARPGSEITMLIAGQYFCNELIETDILQTLETDDSPVVVFALDHAVDVAVADGEPVKLERYSSLVVPASARIYSIAPTDEGTARVIITYMPASGDEVRAELEKRGFNRGEIDAFLAQFSPLSGLGEPPTK